METMTSRSEKKIQLLPSQKIEHFYISINRFTSVFRDNKKTQEILRFSDGLFLV
jgi:hypothetical protein